VEKELKYVFVLMDSEPNGVKYLKGVFSSYAEADKARKRLESYEEYDACVFNYEIEEYLLDELS
jgi:hypothetical protein